MTSYVVSSGQTLSGITAGGYSMPPSRAIYGDTVLVQSGGMLDASTINSPASATVQGGSTTNGVTVSGGIFVSQAGSTINNTVLTNYNYANGSLEQYHYALDVSGVANNTSVSGGNLAIEAGAVATGIDINAAASYQSAYGSVAASLNVLELAKNITVEQGVAIIDATGTLTGATVTGSGSIEIAGIASGLVVSSAGITGSAAGDIVSGGGRVTGTVVNSQGTESVGGGGTANSTVVNAGTQIIASGGIANSTAINQGSMQSILGGGTSNDATVGSGSTIVVASTGLATSLELSGGALLSNAGTVAQGDNGFGFGMTITKGGTITNSGTISGSGAGIFADSTGLISVTNSGVIQATAPNETAIYFEGGGSVTNFGTIGGGTGSAAGLAISSVSHLTLEPGQVMVGQVLATSNAILELAGTSGTLGGLGSQYTGFSTVELDQGQTWSLTGSSSLGSGSTLDLGANSTLDVTGALTGAGSDTIAFQGTSVLSLAVSPTGITVAGFAALDQILLPSITYSSLDAISTTGSVVTIADASGDREAITIAGAGSESFALNSVAGGGSALTVKPVISRLVAHPDTAGTLGIGSGITFDLTPNVALSLNTTSGVPSLGLSDGGTATYDATASSSTTLVFRTMVVAGQNTTDLKVASLSFGNATIVDAIGTSLDLTSVGTLAGSDTGIAIVTTPPTVADTTPPNAPLGLTLAATSDSGVAGDGITNMGSVQVTGSAEAGSTVRLYDNGAPDGSGTAGSTGLFSVGAALAAGGNTFTATATDAAGNVSGFSASLAVTLDTNTPVIASITTSATSPNPEHTGDAIAFTLTPSAGVIVNLTQGSPTLSLSDGGTATYQGSASNATRLVFAITVAAGQTSTDLTVTGLALNGAAITDAAGNALDVTSVPGLAGSDTGVVVNPPTVTPPVLGVTTTAGANGSTIFTTQVGGSNIVTATAAGNDVVNSRGADTIHAGGGFDIVYASGATASVTGGGGNLVFVAGNGNYTAGGGAGVDILYGGLGISEFTGGKAAGSILVAGVGNVTLSGGAGSGALMYGSVGNSVFNGSSGGGDTMVGGEGSNIFTMTGNDLAFGGPGGPDVFNAGSGTSLIVEGIGATTVRIGSGVTTDFAGLGSDTYVATKGQGGTANIIGFKAGDHISLAGGFTAANASSAVSTATTGSFGTTLNLSDGTKVNLFGVSITASQVSVG